MHLLPKNNVCSCTRRTRSNEDPETYRKFACFVEAVVRVKQKTSRDFFYSQTLFLFFFQSRMGQSHEFVTKIKRV